MEEKNKHIETLLERFFEGQTSNDEERQLYLFFGQEELPDELVQYKQVFKYFESGLVDELEAVKEMRKDTKTRHLSVTKKRWFVWGSVAASVLLILFSTLFYFDHIESAAPLAGSYIIRNGVRITDLDLIRPELEATLQSISQQQEEWEQMIAQFVEMEDLDIQILQQIVEDYQSILEDIQDENIRKEMEEFLYINF